MSYIFQNIQKKVYDKTFLKDVQVFVSFADIVIDDSIISSLRSFFKEEFNTNFDEIKYIQEKVGIKSNDELIFFYFAKNYVRLKVCFPAYSSSLLPDRLLPKINKYLSVLGVTDLLSVKISKYNQLQFEMQKEGMNVSHAMKKLFSEKLLNYGQGENNSFEDNSRCFAELSRWEKQISIDDSDDSRTGIAIEYGFCENSSDNNNGVLTLKNTIFTVSAIKVNELIRKYAELDNILDNCFVWCINNNIIKSISKNE